MKCLSCGVSFDPQMHQNLIGRNANTNLVYVYFQMCPECKQPIVGVKEITTNSSMLDYDGVMILKRG